MVGGIISLPTDYAARIQNFLSQYLGTPQQPVPFGGREADLARLDTWLRNPQQPPYGLLAAPAGRGKSVLLVHWSQRLISRGDVAVVFFPISIRFRTNLQSVVFPALTARLAYLHGDPVPGTPDIAAEAWRGMLTDYLTRPLPEGQQLLLILDGLDEAADWEAGPDLFPFSLPAGVRVLVSARYLAGDTDAAAWRRRLGWDQPGRATCAELDPLTLLGVGDVLTQMGVPLDRLGARVDIVRELHRLSEGDPLLVRLYVEDLWARGEAAARLQPEDLRDLRPGLAGFFDRWWDDQRRWWGANTPLREAAVQRIFNWLACALGPLTQDDILDHLEAAGAGLTTWTLEEAMRLLNRFVIGDGRDQGYAFSHLRLNSYFYDKLSRRERQVLESQFLSWGEKTLKALNAGKVPPGQVSSYLLQYYRAHLERAGAGAEAFIALVSEEWLKAWYHLEGAYGGFLNDVGRVWQVAEQLDAQATNVGEIAPYLGTEIRCALCFASVNNLTGNIPPELLVALVRVKIWTPVQGLAYARQMPDAESRLQALSMLVSHLSASQQQAVLAEALAAARALGNEYCRAQALAVLAPCLALLPITELYLLWQETFHILAERRRHDLLSDIDSLISIIALLGKEKALVETAYAIKDVGRWWP